MYNNIITVRPGVLMLIDRHELAPKKKSKREVNELERLAHLVVRDDTPNGIEYAIEFAERTMKAYRRAVVNPDGIPALTYASEIGYRKGYIESYLQFKRFLEAIQRAPEAYKEILPLESARQFNDNDRLRHIDFSNPPRVLRVL